MREAEKTRYFRQLLLPDFGEADQDKLRQATVLIAGAGGLGSPVSIYLAAAGIGKLIICDLDTVELSNLNRQVLHGTPDIGAKKTKSATKFITNLNPAVQIEAYSERLSQTSLKDIGKDTNVIADCLDNINTRLEINQFSMDERIPIVHGGIEGWSGQVTTLSPPGTPCMKCLFGDAKDTDDPKPVLGAVAGLIGTTQALEIIGLLTGRKENLENLLMHFDGQSMEWTRIRINRNKECSACCKLYE